MSEEKKNKMKHIDAIILTIVLVGVLVWMAWPIIPIHVSSPDSTQANVQLSDFSDDSANSWIEVRVQLKNIGGETAHDVSVRITCCDQNDTQLFDNTLLTFPSLNAGETCSGEYSIYLTGDEAYVTHDITVSWGSGENSYFRMTKV